MASHESLSIDPEVSPVGSFALYERDLLQISATISICLFLQAPIGRIVGHLLSRHGGQKSKALSSMLQPWIWGRLVVELGVLLAIVILTVVEAFHSNIRPFTRDPFLPPRICLRLIYNIAISRFLVFVRNNLSGDDVIRQSGNRVNKIRSLTGHTGNPCFDLFYSIISIVSNIISLGFGENHLLVLTSSVMELNCVHLAFRRLSELGTWRTKSKTSFKSTLFCSAIFSITRIILPIIFLGLAVSKESPLLMSMIPLIWFAFCCIFYTTFHSYLLYHCARQLVQALSSTSSLPPALPIQSWRNDFSDCLSNNTTPFAIPYSPDFYTNDLRSSSNALKVPVTEDSPRASGWQEKSLLEAKIGLNYGFLHCYDNRNLCNSRFSGMDEKVNVGLKKDTEKEKLFSWSDHSMDVVDKIPDEKAFTKDEYRKLETGTFLGCESDGRSVVSSEDDSHTMVLSQCATGR